MCQPGHQYISAIGPHTISFLFHLLQFLASTMKVFVSEKNAKENMFYWNGLVCCAIPFLSYFLCGGICVLVLSEL